MHNCHQHSSVSGLEHWEAALSAEKKKNRNLKNVRFIHQLMTLHPITYVCKSIWNDSKILPHKKSMLVHLHLWTVIARVKWKTSSHTSVTIKWTSPRQLRLIWPCLSKACCFCCVAKEREAKWKRQLTHSYEATLRTNSATCTTQIPAPKWNVANNNCSLLLTCRRHHCD